MRGSRTTTYKKAEVITAKLKNPDAKLTNIQKETGLPTSTIDDILKKDLPEVRKSSVLIAELIDRNDTLLELTDIELKERLQGEEKEKIRPSELVSIRESAFKQNQLLTGGSTDNQNKVGESEEELRTKLAELQEKNKHLK